MIWLAFAWDFYQDRYAAHTYIVLPAWRGAFSAVFKFVPFFFDISHLDSHAAYQSQTCLYSRLGIAKCVRIIVDIVSARCSGEGIPFERFISVRRERRHRGIAPVVFTSRIEFNEHMMFEIF